MEQQLLKRRGFSLSELLLAVVILTLIILTLVALTTSAIRANEKAEVLGPAGQVAEALLTSEIYGAQWDTPAGKKAQFWAASGQWIGPTQVKVGGVNYEYIVLAETVLDTAGNEVGVDPANPQTGNRLKRVELILTWWDATAANSGRQGYGRLQTNAIRLVNELGP